ncbi:UNVERIFIED_CONTAM: hypothetical protein Sradi_3008600 [Sesamum radiatum]|uniref:DUF4283 domain-containing protein n=1 Tax=Sesamum radiatum TaxID=300843 RepID=A0AAW2S126_SESRA
MDSLSSLSCNPRTNSTVLHLENPSEDDDDGGDRTAVAANIDKQLSEFVNKGFKFAEFHKKASRVIEHGDMNLVAVLNELKCKWEDKFGKDTMMEADHETTSLRATLKPVSEHIVTPFRAPQNHVTSLIDTPVVAGTNKENGENFGENLNKEGQRQNKDKGKTVVHDHDIFVGNIRLTGVASHHENPDPISDGFAKSTRRTLRYVAPDRQSGEVIVTPTLAMIEEGARKWLCTAVGYFLGRKPFFPQFNAYVQSTWPAVREVIATASGFYFIKFNTNVAMDEVIEGGPWLFHGQPIMLQKWEPGMVMRKHLLTNVPVWIKLQHLPTEY